jgi:glycosyltransferase involved in cell wall biosynthesis
MKILVLNGSNFVKSNGGQATFVQNIDDVLKAKAEVDYLNLPDNVLKQNVLPLRLFYFIQVLHFFIFSNHKKYEYIVSHTPEASFAVSFFKTPFCHIFHGNTNCVKKSKFWYGKYFSLIFEKFEKRILKKAVKCYTVGEARLDAEHIFVPIKTTKNNILPIERSGIFFAGRLESVKNLDRIISIYSELPNSLREKNKLHIIGTGTREVTLRNLVDKNCLEDQVVFYGHLPNSMTLERIKSFKILLMASANEGFPMIIGESLSLGIPVVTSDVGGISKVIKNGVNGFCIPLKSDNLTYIDAIKCICENYEKFSLNAEKSASVFSPESLCTRILADFNLYSNKSKCFTKSAYLLI